MENLAKIGIVLTNIALVIGAFLVLSVATGMGGFIGLLLGAVFCMMSATGWFMAVDCYEKFSQAHKKYMSSK